MALNNCCLAQINNLKVKTLLSNLLVITNHCSKKIVRFAHLAFRSSYWQGWTQETARIPSENFFKNTMNSDCSNSSHTRSRSGVAWQRDEASTICSKLLQLNRLGLETQDFLKQNLGFQGFYCSLLGFKRFLGFNCWHRQQP